MKTLEETVNALKAMPVKWQKTGESDFVFQTEFDGQSVRLRLNDFPDEPICSVLAAGEEMDLDSFPGTWELLKGD